MAWIRLAAGVLVFGAVLGILVSGVPRGADAEGETPPGKPAPEAPLTGYVDFIDLLKRHGPLLSEQHRISQGLEDAMAMHEANFQPLIRAQEQVLQTNQPDTRPYRTAIRTIVELQRQLYQAKLLTEQQAQADLRDEGIRAFNQLRGLVQEIAGEMGYTQVLNIVRDPAKIAGAREDFQLLQQQLLVSPVMVFDPAFDITDVVAKRADERWGLHLSFLDGEGGNAILCYVDGQRLSLNGDNEYEIRLGQTVQFKVTVLERDEALDPDEENARVRWRRTGVETGTINSTSGDYTAPENTPEQHTFRIVALSAVKPDLRAEVAIRLVDKDGKPLAADE